MVRDVVRSMDTVGRWSGEELSSCFLTWTRPRCSRSPTACALPSPATGYRPPPRSGSRLSVGATSSPRDGDSPDGVPAAADHAMYAAKHMGRNRTYSAADPPDSTRHASPIAHVLDCALA